jgi:hypothetical protein
MPAELRQAAVKISRRYPHALVRRVLKIDPWRFNRPLMAYCALEAEAAR